MHEDEETEALKRQASYIASLLPNSRRDALSVLDYAREIILLLGRVAPDTIRLVGQTDRAAHPPGEAVAQSDLPRKSSQG